MQHMIAPEAEAAFSRLQLFQDLRHSAPITRDPTEAAAVGDLEASFRCCSGAATMLTSLAGVLTMWPGTALALVLPSSL